MRLLVRLRAGASSADIQRVMNGLRSTVGSSLMQVSLFFMFNGGLHSISRPAPHSPQVQDTASLIAATEVAT